MFFNPIMTLFLSLCISTSECCDYSIPLKKKQKTEYNSADLIFIGRVTHINEEDKTYEMEIIEVFKGNHHAKTIKGKSWGMCSSIPSTSKGKWIIYANFIESDFVGLSPCGLSRSLNNPHQIPVKEYNIIPPPPFQRYHDDIVYSVQFDIDYSRQMLKLNEIALNDLEKEIISLRKRRE
ncbi:hypothetical protein BH23BAC1_BH23BAC1_50380 [soil metagenome]